MEREGETPRDSEEEAEEQEPNAENPEEEVEENGDGGEEGDEGGEEEEGEGGRRGETCNGFISGGRAAKEEEEEPTTELQPGDPVTPQHILRLVGYTREYLCSPAENTFNINFSRFKIRDLQSGAVLLDIKKHCPTEMKDGTELDIGRFIRYRFSPVFLSLREIGATLEFTVGSREVTRFRLIERHYFRNMLLKTFDFEIGFCMPHSRNTYEHIYCLPDLESHTVEEMIANPFETRSDSFYFANNRLIMHHKAEYCFSGGPEGQGGLST